MKIKPVGLLLVGVALGGYGQDRPAIHRASVEQVERLIATAKTHSDAEQARDLSSLELTERLNGARLQQLSVELAGEKSRQALLALADISSFLAPPVMDIPATAAPDQPSQRRMLAHTVDYLAKALPLLPNLFATRETRRFENRPTTDGELDDDPLRGMDHSVATVFYRNGQEFLDNDDRKQTKRSAPDRGLATWGEFGPILGIVFMDAARSELGWSHWELASGGPLAVFRYSVPKVRSHYDVRFCCVTTSYGLERNLITERAGYHGEFALDPDTGTILRLTVISDFDAGNPIGQASILVEYGPEDIGGRTYICPLHGIAIAKAPDLNALNRAMAQLQNGATTGARASMQPVSVSTLANGPQQVLLNDVTFRDYDVFRSESRVLTAKEAQNTMNVPAPVSEHAADSVKPTEETASESSPSAVQPVAESVVASPPATASVSNALPEVYVTIANGLPSVPAITPAAASNAGPTYRIDARLVDVSLVAFDKKGRPLTNLNAADLEIYDNGTKVDVRAFSQAGETPHAETSPAEQVPGTPGEEGFSNRNNPLAKASARDHQNTIVLLIDNALAIEDVFNVREQMTRFIRGLKEDEKVAVYVMQAGGFKILQNSTTDHNLVASLLAKWVPSSDNILLGEEQEARNRQQMEYVHNTEDLLAVNGHANVVNESQAQASDPKLRELGDNPGVNALSSLVLLARNLASIPGHKSLVWIASDNVLADWTNASMNIDKGSHYIEPAALHAQEAMNEAHVSVYPMDASHIEAGGIDASISSTNVQLNPTATANQIGGCGNAAGVGVTAGPELTSGADISTCGKNLSPGRITAQMQQDLHSIQGVYREIADATGGRVFRRASDMVSELNQVASDGRSTYLISFAPSAAADNKYHIITIKLTGHKDVNLRYRTGYFYRQEPATLQDRFREAVLQPDNATEIGLTAHLSPDPASHTVKLGISATDIEVAQQDSLWTDRLDVYLVQRETSGTKAQISGQCMDLHLRSETYQKYLREGIPFDQVLEVAPGMGSVRLIVVDENSGRMGSVTIPASELGKHS